jgi:dimeric dUTPase (all-alpha-NTP-PPase superfamily)
LTREREILAKLESYKAGCGDKLEALLDLQNTFDNYIKDKRNLDYSDKEQWVQNLSTAIIMEACELKDACSWKWWKNKGEVDWENVKEEIIDIWHFLMSVSLKIGLSAEDILSLYIEKNIENYKRQLGTSVRKDYIIGGGE